MKTLFNFLIFVNPRERIRLYIKFAYTVKSLPNSSDIQEYSRNFLVCCTARSYKQLQNDTTDVSLIRLFPSLPSEMTLTH